MGSPQALRLGVDVGGTNTDAVLIAGEDVLAWSKSPTTADIEGGIVAVIGELLRRSGHSPADIAAVMIGTTHFTNAVVQRRGLLPTVAIRLALPATQALPPMSDWPADMRTAVDGQAHMLAGGYEFDGREISPLDEAGLQSLGAELSEKGILAVAVTSTFSPINAFMEDRAAEILIAQAPGLKISLSNRIGRIGLLERENATILNASLAGLAEHVITSLRRALVGVRVQAPLFFSQNDGTLMSAEFLERYPILAIRSGATNSMRGAAFLSGLREAIVMDVGGTTTDVGMLVHGFPREAAGTVELGGVRTNFRMPDVISIGLGGGSLVSAGPPLGIGPESVGHRLSQESTVFGGSRLTATDLAVAAGQLDVGDSARVGGLDRGFVRSGMEFIQAQMEELVDRVRTSPAPIPLVLVGGGAPLLSRTPPGVSEVIRPKFASVANAVGAGIGQVGGEIDRVFALDALPREEAVALAKRAATEKAVLAGADATSVELVDFEEVPLPYLPGNSVRIRVRAVGPLSLLTGQR